MNMRLLFVLLFLQPTLLYSYTVNRGNYGQELSWSSSNQSIFFNSANSSSLSNSSLTGILNNSISEFSGTGFNLSQVSASSSLEGRNDIYFSNDSNLFGGTSVLALTRVSYSDGTAIEADIIINDSVTFSNSTSSNNYIGNILTHELGHLVGLGHSQVLGSSMLYTAYKGQHSLHNDDLSGVKHLYNTNYSEITGRVAGGNNVGVFGAHVQAISTNSGKVMSATVSESDGTFILSGLSSSDTYYLYVEPLEAISNMPSHLSTVKKNFCLSQENYRGTFFQSCRNSENGHPQGIKFTSTSVINVGDISIGCDLSVSSQYMQNKSTATNTLNIVDFSGNAGDAITGYYSENDVTNNIADEYEIDLRDYNLPDGDIYLDIKLVSQSMYSPIRLSLTSLTETIIFEDAADGYGLIYDQDGNPNLDIVGRINLSSTTSSNIFKFSITPEKIYDYIASKPFTLDTFLPNSNDYKDDQNFYLMILTVSKKVSGNHTIISKKSYNLQDNSTCLDAPSTYSVQENSQIKSSALQELEKRRGQKDPQVLSCGTVGTPGGPSSGTKSFILAFMVGLLLANTHRLVRFQ